MVVPKLRNQDVHTDAKNARDAFLARVELQVQGARSAAARIDSGSMKPSEMDEAQVIGSQTDAQTEQEAAAMFMGYVALGVDTDRIDVEKGGLKAAP